MITKESMKKVIGPAMEKFNNMQNVVGCSFNKCFKELRYIKDKNGFTIDGEKDELLSRTMQKVDKKEVIIFSLDKKKIDNMATSKKKIIFPFDKIFIEYPIMHHITNNNNVYIKFTNGFFINSIKDDNGNITSILIFSIWMDYGQNNNNMNEEGINPKIIYLPYNKLNDEITFPEYYTKENKDIATTVIEILKKICYLIQRKEYNEYYKWTPSGIIKKEIVYSHDVKSHKRHFWKDTGRFKIATMSKEELIKNCYEIDECVFKGYELRRDVPYRVINSFKVGEHKGKDENNRIINILKKRIFRNEEKLGFILSKIFTDEYIKKHDRKQIKPLELDFYIHRLKIAFEYDGEQHYDRKVCEEVFKSNFELQRGRDIKKNALCRRKKIKLIRVKYNEPLTITNIKRLIKDKHS